MSWYAIRDESGAWIPGSRDDTVVTTHDRAPRLFSRERYARQCVSVLRRCRPDLRLRVVEVEVTETDKNQKIVEAEENMLIDFQFLAQELIDRSGLSRAEIAARAGITEARLSWMLSPEADPTLKNFARVLFALGEHT